MREKMPRFQDPYVDAAEKFSSPKPEDGIQYEPLSVLGTIREKGFDSAADHPVSLPRITVVPFPVARHRSHGPHWTPLASTSATNESDGAGEEMNETSVDGRASAQALHRSKPKGTLNFGNWRELLAKPPASKAPSVEEEIDGENRGKILSMTPEEIGEAQRELLERLGSEKLSMLRRRGAEKEKQRLQGLLTGSPIETKSPADAGSLKRKSSGDSQREEARPEPEEAMEIEAAPSSEAMEIDPEAGAAERPNDSSSAATGNDQESSWTKRVEAAKLLRFDLAGFVIGKDEDEEPVPGVSERDILRAEGDPASFGYTIKEAALLSRSTIPGQRVAALQLLGAVLLNASGGLARGEKTGDETDWQAVWSYALGPHPELALTLRLALDDSHLTALIWCAKALSALLSCAENEKFFNLAEALWPGMPLVYTGPVFRQRRSVDDGFLGAGNWKYNIKSSELLTRPPSNNNEDQTVGDDATVASKDVAGGLLRMGILPRIRYILEVEKLQLAEEPLLSIVICLARHSPAAAEAVMACPRLIDDVVQGILLRNDCLETTRARAIELLKVLSQASKVYCLRFAESGALQAASSELFKASHETKQRALIESLRLWRVCVHNNVGVSMFSDFFPAISFRLLPSAEAGVASQECYNLLEILARKLPALGEEQQGGWSWSVAVPIILTSLEWLQVPDVGTAKVEILGSVLHFLATVCQRVLEKEELPWLPEFVPQLGLALVRSKLFGFGRGSGETLVSALLKMRSITAAEKLLPLVTCLRASLRLARAVDKLLEQARSSSTGGSGCSDDEVVLRSGLVSSARAELEQLVVLVDDIDDLLELLGEFNGRGGPAPGIGFGWGARDGGFWSPKLLLAQAYAGIVFELDDVLRPGLETKLGLCRLCFEPSTLQRILSEHVFSREQWDSTLANAQQHLKLKSYQSSELEDCRELLIQHYAEEWLQRKAKKKQNQDSAELSTIQEEDEGEVLPVMSEWSRVRLPLPAHWTLSALHSAMETQASSLRVLAGLLLQLGVKGEASTRRIHALSTVFAAGDLFLDEAMGEVLGVLQERLGIEPELEFERDVDPNYAQFAEVLALNFTSSSYGDVRFGRQLAFYLRPQVSFSVHKVVWRVLEEAKMLSLIPSLGECAGPPSAYLDPPQRNLEALEMYVSTWTRGGLDKAFTRRALTFELAIHHVARFVFEEQDSGLIHHRTKMIRNIIRSIKRSPTSQEMFKELMQRSGARGRLFIEEACAGTPSLDEWQRFDVRER